MALHQSGPALSPSSCLTRWVYPRGTATLDVPESRNWTQIEPLIWKLLKSNWAILAKKGGLQFLGAEGGYPPPLPLSHNLQTLIMAADQAPIT